MNLQDKESPLLGSSETKRKMDKWIQSQLNGDATNIDVYGKPSETQLNDLEKVRNLSKELQNNLEEIENTVRNDDLENSLMTEPASILDYSENHEFVSANKYDDFYAEEDLNDAREQEKKRLTKGKSAKTEIQKFYKDQCVFLTGGTGFLGKVTIEKLLRSCGDVDTIYILIRSKKGKDATSRLHDLLDEFIFHRAHDENPKGIYKVVAINGDMSLPGLGITDQDRKLLTEKVTIILNAAATVRFDEKLSVATSINVRGTREVIRLARECRHLRALTHISTAFAHTYVKQIEEKFYSIPLTLDALETLSTIDETILDHLTPKLLDTYPNTYCFTKAVAEDVVRTHAAGMPVCILRPGIVISTYEEPVRGWTDSLYGPTGIVVGTGTGALRTMYLDTTKVADVVPVDLTVNAILASAWHTAKNYKENQTSEIPIYNFVSGAQNPMTWGQIIKLSEKNGMDKPSAKAVWYYSLIPTTNYYLFLMLDFFLHYIPALLIDGYYTVIGHRRRMVKLYNKVTRMAHILFYFSMQDWRFKDDNLRGMWASLSQQDMALFPFSMADMSWDTYMQTFIVGLRVYVVKDDLSTLPEARKKWNRLFYMHQAVKATTLFILLLLGYWLIRLFI